MRFYKIKNYLKNKSGNGFNRKSMLQKAVLLGIAGLSLSISFLGTANASWEKTKSHEGYDQYLISGGGKPVFEVTIFHGTEAGRQVADELLRPYIAKDDKAAAYELTPAMVDRVLSTLQMTADMVGRNKTSTDPVRLYINGYKENDNAFAGTYGGTLANELYAARIAVAKANFNTKKYGEYRQPVGIMGFGKWGSNPSEANNWGYSLAVSRTVPRLEDATSASLESIVYHEFQHAMGFISYLDELPKWPQDGSSIETNKAYTYEDYKQAEQYYRIYGPIWFDISQSVASPMMEYLRDANGNKIAFIKNDKGEPVIRVVADANKAKTVSPNEPVFVVKTTDTLKYFSTKDKVEALNTIEQWRNDGLGVFGGIWQDSETESPIYVISGAKYGKESNDSGVFLESPNVLEVLDGAHIGFDEKQQRKGLPINGWELYDYELNGEHWSALEDKAGKQLPKHLLYAFIEMSHDLSLNSLMSHLDYRNMATFNEVVLAAMQDFGMDLDRREYFGKSYYGSGITDINIGGFSERNKEGTAYLVDVPNKAKWGIGLHVLGKNNTITQQGDILSEGQASVGVLLSGLTTNTVRIPKDTTIRMTGEKSDGFLVNYGNSHNVYIDGVVSSTGAEGIGLRLDFGGNILMNSLRVRGSYLDLAYDDDKNQVKMLKDFASELNGPLTKDVVIGGTIEGKEAAIYIGETAYVPSILVRPKATIMGDIRSQWGNIDALASAISGKADTSVSDAVKKAIEGRYTTLTFEGRNYYGGWISGPYSLDLHITPALASETMETDSQAIDVQAIDVHEGLHYYGTADVHSVTVAPGAVLRGGTYKNSLDKNSLDKNLLENAATLTTPAFFTNRGTIGAFMPDGKQASNSLTGMNIYGNADLVTSRVVVPISQTTVGAVTIYGTAQVAGTKLLLDPASQVQTGYEYKDFLRAQSFTGLENLTVDTGDKLVEANYVSNDSAHQKAVDKVTSSDQASSDTSASPISAKHALANTVESIGDIVPNTATTMPLYSIGTLTLVPKNPSRLPAAYTAEERAVYNGIYGAYGSDMKPSLRERYDTILNSTVAENKALFHSLYANMPVEESNRSLLDGYIENGLFTHLWGSTDRKTAEQDIWAVVNKSWLDTYGDGYLANVSGHTSNVVVGADVKRNAHCTVGGLLAFSDSTLNHQYGSLKSKIYSAGLYGLYGEPKEGSLMLYTTYGAGRNKQTRYTALNAAMAPLVTRDSRSDYSSRIWKTGALYGKTHTYERGNVTPYIGLEYGRYTMGGYTEAGTEGFAVHMPSQGASMTSVVAGVQGRTYGTDGVFWGGGLQYRRVLNGTDTVWDSDLGAGNTIPVRAHQIGKDRLTLQVELGREVNDHFAIKGSASHTVASGAKETAVGLDATWKF